MSKYTEKDAAKDTGVKPKEVNEAWHTARDDAVKGGDLQRGSAPGSGGQGGSSSNQGSGGKK